MSNSQGMRQRSKVSNDVRSCVKRRQSVSFPNLDFFPRDIYIDNFPANAINHIHVNVNIFLTFCARLSKRNSNQVSHMSLNKKEYILLISCIKENKHNIAYNNHLFIHG